MTLGVFERNWVLLWNGPPGKRFQNYYRRNHKNGVPEGLVVQTLRLGAAFAFLCVGLLLLVLPLVYIPFLLVSAALFASESRTIARFLDHGEAWSRDQWSGIKARFGISQRGAKMTLGVLGFGCVALAAYTCYRKFFR
jgi:hypothetical protein